MDDNTKVTKVEVSPSEMNELLDLPGAESVLLPDTETKPSFFSAGGVNMDFLTKAAPKKAPAPAPKPADKPADGTTSETSVDALTSIIEEVHPTPEEDTPAKEAPKGRPAISKEGTVELAKKLIEKGVLVPFDDDKNIEDYTIADFEELLEANIRDKEDKIKQETPIEFFDSLPRELQYAAKYVADGGQDMKGLFKALAEVQESRELSIEKPKDQETICREYLSATNFGSAEDIDEEIDGWKDRNELDKKAEKFKPRLDQMREDQIAQKLAHQEQARQQQIEASQNYAKSVYDTLKPAVLNGLKLDKKTQEMLYSGMVQPQYPSITGKSTNLFGHLIEKYQFVEPNHALIAEVLWHLADPDGFKAKVKEAAKIETTEVIARKLKTEESRKIGSSSMEEKQETIQKKIPRNTNFFKR